MENENWIYHAFRPSHYDAVIFFSENIFIFWRQAFRHKKSHLFHTTITSLEHNIHILGTQLPHLRNTTATSQEHNQN